MFKKLLSTLGATASTPSGVSTEFIMASREGLMLQTSNHVSLWHLGEEKNWSADLDRGTITFHFADDTVASASIQVVGTYNTSDGSFLWGWDHPSIPENLRQHARLAHRWGEENQMKNFMSRKVKCSEDDAWGFAAVANRLGNGNGVYRGPDGTTLVFMTFGEIQLAKPS